MKEIKNLLLVLVAAIFFLGMYFVCDRYAQDVIDEYSGQINPSLIAGSTEGKNGSVSPTNELGVEHMVQDMVAEGYSSNITISVAGDILTQTNSVYGAYRSDTQSFDFSPCFSEVKSLLDGSEFTVATLKTTLAGAYNGASSEVAGYGTISGMSNTPEILAADIAEAGIDLVNTATNHTLDSGISGVINTLSFLNEAGLVTVGTCNENSSDLCYEGTIDGISIAVLGYTNSVNNAYGSEYDGMINNLKEYDAQRIENMCSQVTDLKSRNEVVMIMLNFGSVSSSSVDSEQRSLASKLVDAGADVVLGTGSRAIKPMELITVTDQRGRIRNGFVFYGLGALMTAEDYIPGDLDVDLGAIIQLKVNKNGIGEAIVTGFDVVPVYLSKQSTGTVPVPICEAVDKGTYSDTFTESELDRMKTGYTSVIEQLVSGTTLAYSYDNYEYSVSLQ